MISVYRTYPEQKVNAQSSNSSGSNQNTNLNFDFQKEYYELTPTSTSITLQNSVLMNSEIISYNGVILNSTSNYKDYQITGDLLTLNFIPETGDLLRITYVKE